MTINPVPLRARHDGWTPERQALFLQALEETASVKQAAERVGMSAKSAYRLRRRPEAEAFRGAWDATLKETWAKVEMTALERVIRGEISVLEVDGITVTKRRPCSASLMIRMLERAERAKEREREKLQKTGPL